MLKIMLNVDFVKINKGLYSSTLNNMMYNYRLTLYNLYCNFRFSLRRMIDQASDEPTENEPLLRNRRKIRKTD